MNIKHCILSFLLLCSNLLYANDIKFTASVSKTQVAVGENFEVTFSVNSNGDDFTPPDFKGFQILSGPNMSSSITSVNGNVSASISYSYDLVAVKEGEYTIGPASIVVNGKRLTTKSIKIKVVKGQHTPQNNQAAGQSISNDEDAATGKAGDVSKSLFIRAIIDKSNVYQGEQLTLSYRLYTRVALVSNEWDKLPDLNGFWSHDIKDSNPNTQWKTEIYKGVTYNVADIKQTILFPERSGNLVIDPMEMTFTVRQAASSNDIFDQFFGSYKDVKYKVKSIPLTVYVKPLPDAGKPAGFSGAVGRFSLDADLDKNELKANEALNYKLKISGTGNLQLIQPLDVNFPADFEKYDPKVTDAIPENVNKVSGSRVYNYLLIPRHEGNYTIEPAKFSYFDPSAGKYVTLSAKAFQIKVNKGISEGNVTAFASPDKQDIKLLNQDIRYIKTNGSDFRKKGEGFYGSALYYLLLLAGPFLFLLAIAFRKWNDKNNSDLIKVKSRKARKIAEKHLSNAEKQLLASNSKTFYEAVFKGLYGYLSDKLNIPAAHLSKETIAADLSGKLDQELILQLLSTLDLCEMARFSSISGISEQEVFERAKSIISDIENKI